MVWSGFLGEGGGVTFAQIQDLSVFAFTKSAQRYTE